MVARQPEQDAKLPATFVLPKAIGPSQALEVVKRTTKEAADIARAVVVAKCLESKVAYGPGGNIFTYISFETIEAVKGDPGRNFTLRLLGGRIGDTEIPLALDGEFTSGFEYVLMLGPEGPEGSTTINPAAVFVVRTEPESKRKVVVPGGDGYTLYNKATGRRIVGSREWVFLDDFVFSLQKALR